LQGKENSRKAANIRICVNLQGMDFARNAYAYSLYIDRLCCVYHSSVGSSIWPTMPVQISCETDCILFLRAKAATAARLSHRNSVVWLSVTRVDQSKTVQAKITKSLQSAA